MKLNRRLKLLDTTLEFGDLLVLHRQLMLKTLTISNTLIRLRVRKHRLLNPRQHRRVHADNLRCVVLHIPDVDGTLGTATGFGVNRSIAASI